MSEAPQKTPSHIPSGITGGTTSQQPAALNDLVSGEMMDDFTEAEMDLEGSANVEPADFAGAVGKNNALTILKESELEDMELGLEIQEEFLVSRYPPPNSVFQGNMHPDGLKWLNQDDYITIDRSKETVMNHKRKSRYKGTLMQRLTEVITLSKTEEIKAEDDKPRSFLSKILPGGG